MCACRKLIFNMKIMQCLMFFFTELQAVVITGDYGTAISQDSAFCLVEQAISWFSSFQSRVIREIHSASDHTYTFIHSASQSQIKIILSLLRSQMSSVWNCHRLISITAYFHALRSQHNQGIPLDITVQFYGKIRTSLVHISCNLKWLGHWEQKACWVLTVVIAKVMWPHSISF